MHFPHWQHFLSLEKDFIETIEFVELDAANDGTFSVAYTKLLLAICSEVDVVAKLVCKKINPASSARNIDDYRQEIAGKYPSFHTVECMIPRYGINLKPWSNWSGANNPVWWQEHNKVKHQRDTNSSLANQKNVKESLCGLFCLLLYLYQTELYTATLSPLPVLLDYERMPGHLSVNPGAVLPDIPR
ncbi:hypothetical protein QFX18_19250 [Saccharophagus degradans]|uniref:hypothetical protein n=1 Tax=Saccharophagus degradans TaxID=86304 RepID=UPI00247808D4|nr:hypothetical protein [Saccharophagus degradans]WGO98147.1 hypothetical protein QFX18_19250 [Saccharophagus degradans]